MQKIIYKCLLFFCLIASTTALAATDSNVSYDVFLVPDSAITQHLQQINQQLNQVGLQSLSQQGYLSHVTLYLTEYSATNLTKIEQTVAKLAQQQHSFTININSIMQTKDNWLMLTVQDNPKLQRLADETVMALSPLRASHPTLPSWVKDYPNKLNSFNLYGSPNVFDNFQPHLTLLPPANVSKLSKFMDNYGKKFKPFSVKVIGIGIAQVNQNGQSKKPIKLFYFPKNN